MFLTTVYSTLAHQITATIVFENNTDHTQVTGVFYITETNQSYPVNSLDSFTVELPKKGKYEFGFYSEDVHARTYYPVRITERNNTITVRLENKIEEAIANPSSKNMPLNDISNLSIEQLEEQIALGTINFIVHGLVPPNAEAVEIFKKEFGIGIRSENCAIDPISFKIAMETNKKLEVYLTSKFGNDWKHKIPVQPFGLQIAGF